MRLKYDSGNVISPKVHQIGVLALGSPLENHGSVLPIDTDSKIASYIALNSSIKTGAAFIGIIPAGTEYSYVEHGIHLKKEDIINNQIIPFIKNNKEKLQLEKIVIVNAHGGNNLIQPEIEYIEKKTKTQIIFNNSIIENEDAHASTVELSMGKALGIADINRLDEHKDTILHPEVAMIGLKKARINNKEIDNEAKIVEENGFKIDETHGKYLLDNAIENVIKDIKKLI